MIITERRLRRIIREELLRESHLDDFLEDVDNTLTGIDVVSTVATFSGVAAPLSVPAERIISALAGVVDIIQMSRALVQNPPDYETAGINLVSALFSFFAMHSAGKLVSKTLKGRSFLVQIGIALIDECVSLGKIDEDDAPEIKKEINKFKDLNVPLPAPSPALAIDDGTSENIDDGESDGAPDPYVPAQPKPSQPRSPAAPGPASGCPISKRFYFTYDAWDTSIWDSSRNAAVAIGTGIGTLLGGTNWVIKSVASDVEGSPTSITLVDATDPGKCLMLLPLNSP
jgi:hypothetical protein